MVCYPEEVDQCIPCQGGFAKTYKLVSLYKGCRENDPAPVQDEIAPYPALALRSRLLKILNLSGKLCPAHQDYQTGLIL